RTARYKLIYVYDHDFFELYDLKNDPEEMNNLAQQSEHAGTVALLKEKLKQLRKRYNDTLGKEF
ncbi:MAG: sulfatase/phosphatase domain-containing protein, partial [Planctomycetota bacterium]